MLCTDIGLLRTFHLLSDSIQHIRTNRKPDHIDTEQHTMSERRSLFVALVALSLCVSIWHISTQQSQLLEPAAVVYLQQQQPLIDANRIADSATPTTSTTAAADISLDTLPANDFAQLIDITDFAFVIDQSACGNGALNATTTVDLLVIVHSAPANHAKRQVIRDTWAHGLRAPHARLLFLLGLVADVTSQRAIEAENAQHADIVQGRFVDAYRNMTYKHVAALKWLVYRCPQAGHLLKLDDDVFVNTRNAIELLAPAWPSASSPSPLSPLRRNLLLCQLQRHVRIKRSYRSKWHVGFRTLRGRYYPDYCPGYAIVYSGDVALRLYREAQRQPYFWIDDVHVTGTLAQAVGVRITAFRSIDGLYMSKRQRDALLAGGPPQSFEDRTAMEMFVFTEPNLQGAQIRQLWRMVSGDRREAANATATAMTTTATRSP